MGTFNTHGGYFAPKDYMRIDAGGSHEENPNGGVQVGMDEQGIPNLLEEGEPVYKDYVFSDNIKAKKSWLEENNIPISYADKLYSEIADAFVDEAEERPNDPISRNGLEAMLIRLAAAQESQKQEAQMKELEQMLSEFSPEELAALEEQLNQDQFLAAPEQGAPIEASPEMMAPEEQQMMLQPQVPVMACGGLLHRYDEGGSTQNPPYQPSLVFNPETGRAEVAIPYSTQTVIEEPAVAVAISPETQAMVDRIHEGTDAAARTIYDVGTTAAKLTPAGPMIAGAQSAGHFLAGDVKGGLRHAGETALLAAGPLIGRMTDSGYRAGRAASDAYDAAYAGSEAVAEPAANAAAAATDAASKVKWHRFLWDPSAVWRSNWYKNTAGTLGKIGKTAAAVGQTAATVATPGGPLVYGVSKGINMVSDIAKNSKQPGITDAFKDFKFSDGGKVRVFENGTPGVVVEGNPKSTINWGDMIRRANGNVGLNDAVYEWTNGTMGSKSGYHWPAYGIDIGYGVDWTRPAATSTVQPFSYTFPGWGNLISDANGNVGLADSFYFNTNGKIGSQAARYPYHYSVGVGTGTDDSGTGLSNSSSPESSTAPATNPKRVPIPKVSAASEQAALAALETGPALVTGGSRSLASSRPIGYRPSIEEEVVPASLPTFARYGKAVGAGLLGLYNAFTPADKYTARRAVPYIPYGNIHLNNVRYEAVDPNTVMNEQLAQSNSTARAIQNSVNPSSTAALLALDNNTNRNLGTGLLQTIQANNQQRNAVIAANNQAEAQRAQFDFGVDAARARANQIAQHQNLQNELMLQRLNYGAEGDKYAAISNQINAGLDALAGIGAENFAMNQINSNTALEGYGMVPDGRGGFMLVPTKRTAWCGGLLKKYKK